MAFKCRLCGSFYTRRADVASFGCTKCKSQNKVVAIRDGWIAVDVSTKSHPGAVVKISADDWDNVRRKCRSRFHATTQGRSGNVYAQSKINGKTVYMHRLVLNPQQIVDHINGDGLDNRRENLRACSYGENNKNSKTRSDNQTGIKGVHIEKRTNMFTSNIRSDGVSYHLGTFATKAAAQEAYEKAAKIHHGEFAYNKKSNVR